MPGSNAPVQARAIVKFNLVVLKSSSNDSLGYRDDDPEIGLGAEQVSSHCTNLKRLPSGHWGIDDPVVAVLELPEAPPLPRTHLHEAV